MFGLLPHAALAQLYTWKDAEGNVIIKNAPPPWFKDTERVRGPRVQVLRNGKVVDDTSWSAEKRQEGREQATKPEAAQSRPTAPKPEAADKGDD